MTINSGVGLRKVRNRKGSSAKTSSSSPPPALKRRLRSVEVALSPSNKESTTSSPATGSTGEPHGHSYQASVRTQPCVNDSELWPEHRLQSLFFGHSAPDESTRLLSDLEAPPVAQSSSLVQSQSVFGPPTSYYRKRLEEIQQARRDKEQLNKIIKRCQETNSTSVWVTHQHWLPHLHPHGMISYPTGIETRIRVDEDGDSRLGTAQDPDRERAMESPLLTIRHGPPSLARLDLPAHLDEARLARREEGIDSQGSALVAPPTRKKKNRKKGKAREVSANKPIEGVPFVDGQCLSSPFKSDDSDKQQREAPSQQPLSLMSRALSSSADVATSPSNHIAVPAAPFTEGSVMSLCRSQSNEDRSVVSNSSLICRKAHGDDRAVSPSTETMNAPSLQCCFANCTLTCNRSLSAVAETKSSSSPAQEGGTDIIANRYGAVMSCADRPDMMRQDPEHGRATPADGFFSSGEVDRLLLAPSSGNLKKSTNFSHSHTEGKTLISEDSDAVTSSDTYAEAGILPSERAASQPPCLNLRHQGSRYKDHRRRLSRTETEASFHTACNDEPGCASESAWTRIHFPPESSLGQQSSPSSGSVPNHLAISDADVLSIGETSSRLSPDASTNADTTPNSSSEIQPAVSQPTTPKQINRQATQTLGAKGEVKPSAERPASQLNPLSTTPSTARKATREFIAPSEGTSRVYRQQDLHTTPTQRPESERQGLLRRARHGKGSSKAPDTSGTERPTKSPLNCRNGEVASPKSKSRTSQRIGTAKELPRSIQSPERVDTALQTFKAQRDESVRLLTQPSPQKSESSNDEDDETLARMKRTRDWSQSIGQSHFWDDSMLSCESYSAWDSPTSSEKARHGTHPLSQGYFGSFVCSVDRNRTRPLEVTGDSSPLRHKSLRHKGAGTPKSRSPFALPDIFPTTMHWALNFPSIGRKSPGTLPQLARSAEGGRATLFAKVLQLPAFEQIHQRRSRAREERLASLQWCDLEGFLETKKWICTESPARPGEPVYRIERCWRTHSVLPPGRRLRSGRHFCDFRTLLEADDRKSNQASYANDATSRKQATQEDSATPRIPCEDSGAIDAANTSSHYIVGKEHRQSAPAPSSGAMSSVGLGDGPNVQEIRETEELVQPIPDSYRPDETSCGSIDIYTAAISRGALPRLSEGESSFTDAFPLGLVPEPEGDVSSSERQEKDVWLTSLQSLDVKEKDAVRNFLGFSAMQWNREDTDWLPPPRLSPSSLSLASGSPELTHRGTSPSRSSPNKRASSRNVRRQNESLLPLAVGCLSFHNSTSRGDSFRHISSPMLPSYSAADAPGDPSFGGTPAPICPTATTPRIEEDHLDEEQMEALVAAVRAHLSLRLERKDDSLSPATRSKISAPLSRTSSHFPDISRLAEGVHEVLQQSRSPVRSLGSSPEVDAHRRTPSSPRSRQRELESLYQVQQEQMRLEERETPMPEVGVYAIPALSHKLNEATGEASTKMTPLVKGHSQAARHNSTMTHSPSNVVSVLPSSWPSRGGADADGSVHGATRRSSSPQGHWREANSGLNRQNRQNRDGLSAMSSARPDDGEPRGTWNRNNLRSDRALREATVHRSLPTQRDQHDGFLPGGPDPWNHRQLSPNLLVPHGSRRDEPAHGRERWPAFSEIPALRRGSSHRALRMPPSQATSLRLGDSRASRSQQDERLRGNQRREDGSHVDPSGNRAEASSTAHDTSGGSRGKGGRKKGKWSSKPPSSQHARQYNGQHEHSYFLMDPYDRSDAGYRQHKAFMAAASRSALDFDHTASPHGLSPMVHHSSMIANGQDQTSSLPQAPDWLGNEATLSSAGRKQRFSASNGHPGGEYGHNDEGMALPIQTRSLRRNDLLARQNHMAEMAQTQSRHDQQPFTIPSLGPPFHLRPPHPYEMAYGVPQEGPFPSYPIAQEMPLPYRPQPPFFQMDQGHIFNHEQTESSLHQRVPQHPQYVASNMEGHSHQYHYDYHPQQQQQQQHNQDQGRDDHRGSSHADTHERHHDELYAAGVSSSPPSSLHT